MSTEPTPPTLSAEQSPPASRFWAGWRTVSIVLVVLALAIAGLRLRTYNEPLERDLGTYLLIGHVMNRGGMAYDDAWEVKPPGIYMIYTAGEWLFGYGPLELYLLGVAAAVVTLAGVYAAGAARGRSAGLWAAAFWVILCSVPSVQANQPNTEVFINACVVWALALLLGAGHDSRGVLRALAVGGLLAFGTIIKQIVIIDAFLLAGAYLLTAWDLPGRRAVRDVAIIAAVGAACWFLVLGYFAAAGRFEIFWLTNFINSRAYAGSPLFNLFRYVREGRFFPRMLWFSTPVFFFIGFGALRDRRLLRERSWLLYLAALLAVQAKIALNGMAFHPHYYQYWLPMLAIGAGWAAGAKAPRFERLPAWSMAAAGALALAVLVAEQGRYYMLPADGWSRLKYGNAVIEERDNGHALAAVLRPGETLYQHTGHPLWYYYTDRLPPSLLLSSDCLNDTWPAAPMILERHLAALEAAPPTLVAVENVDPASLLPAKPPGLIGRLLGGRQALDQGRNFQKVLDTLLPRYRLAAIPAFKHSDHYRFYVLRDSALDRRLGCPPVD